MTESQIEDFGRRMTLPLSDDECVALVREILATQPSVEGERAERAEAAFNAYADRYDHDSNEWLDMDVQTFFIEGYRAALVARCGDDAAQSWLPIETAPRDGTRFLGLTKRGIDFFHWQAEGIVGVDAPIGWRDSFIAVYKEGDGPKLWMPLPAAPAASAGDQEVGS